MADKHEQLARDIEAANAARVAGDVPQVPTTFIITAEQARRLHHSGRMQGMLDAHNWLRAHGHKAAAHDLTRNADSIVEPLD
jgi:hypothetical protein